MENQSFTKAKREIEEDPINLMEARFRAIYEQTLLSLRESSAAVKEATHIFLRWMNEGTVVHIVGAGRTRLAVTIPAHRLAHGGANVYVQDDITPMPHNIKCGGIIAASASGVTPTVLSTLRSVQEQRQEREIKIVGIARFDASEFRSLCDIFIGIAPQPAQQPNPLRALTDSEEHVICGILDAAVAAAGRLGGFDDSRWRLGHEDLGATGPYY